MPVVFMLNGVVLERFDDGVFCLRGRPEPRSGQCDYSFAQMPADSDAIAVHAADVFQFVSIHSLSRWERYGEIPRRGCRHRPDRGVLAAVRLFSVCPTAGEP